MPKALIIGYDPGLNSAFAALDLKGNLVTARGEREWTGSAVAQAIRETGRPLIIAVDRKNASDSAEKLAARFGCRIWSPESDLKVEEKNEAVKILLKEIAEAEQRSYSSHEKDALAAAIFAYKAFAGQFSKIDDTLGQTGMGDFSDEVKRLVISGEAKNINEALETINKSKDREQERPVPKPQVTMQKKSEQMLASKVRDLERSLDIQKMYIEKLENRAKELERAKTQMQEEQLRKTDVGRRQLLENKEVTLRENMISNLHVDLNGLEKENERLKAEVRKRDEHAAILEEGGMPLVPVAEWNRENLAGADRDYRAKDKVLWIRKFLQSNSATKYCIALHPKAVVMDCDDETERTLRNADIAIIRGLVVQMREFYGIARREAAEKTVAVGERTGFLKWIREYRERPKSV